MVDGTSYWVLSLSVVQIIALLVAMWARVRVPLTAACFTVGALLGAMVPWVVNGMTIISYLAVVAAATATALHIYQYERSR